MKASYIWFAVAVGALGPVANAADLTGVRQGELGRPIVRLADQELGYSILHDAGALSRSHRVHLTCTLDGSFLQTYCPTMKYYASCPKAQIVCQ
jgi:hypothetical protein